MSKYHINNKGQPARCYAFKNKCPLGEHFSTKEEAYNSIQSNMSEEYGLLGNSESSELKERYNKRINYIKNTKFNSRKDEEAERNLLARMARRVQGNETTVWRFRDIMKELKKTEKGFALSISQSSKDKVIKANTGFCARVNPEYVKTYKNIKEINYNSMLDLIYDIEDQSIFLDDDVFIGIWKNKEDKSVSLDITKRYSTVEEARKACEQTRQDKYIDLQMEEDVTVLNY